MEYEKLRYKLFTQSYVCKMTVRMLREKYGITLKRNKNTWEDKVLKDYYSELHKTALMKRYSQVNPKNTTERGLLAHFAIQEVSERITPEITDIARTIHIHEGLFRLLVLYDNVPNKISGRSLIVHATPNKPIIDMGYYIAVDENTTKTQLNEAFSELQQRFQMQKEIRNDLDTHKKTLINLKTRRKKTIDDQNKIDIYLKVEKEIEMVLKDKKNPDFEEDYRKEVISPAIERIVGKVVKDGDITRSEKLHKQYKAYYYDVIDSYSLPSYKDLRTIHDLITPKA